MNAAQLVSAAYTNKLNKVQEIIESGIHPNDWTGSSMPAIIAASIDGNTDIVDYLLKQGADPNIYTEDRLSALKSAVKHNHYQTTKLLIVSGADPNYERNNATALMVAADNGAKECVELLLPVTDERYYQKAFEYSSTQEIRDIVKSFAPDVQDVQAFGGPDTKLYIKYNTPPTDPVGKQLWDLFTILMEKETSPNTLFEYSLYRCSLSADRDSVVSVEDALNNLGEKIRKDFDFLFYEEKDLCEKYPEIYEHIRKEFPDSE